jgi:hypothetical protein
MEYKHLHKISDTNILFGTEDESDARFVQMQDCKHFFEVSGIDKWMDEHIESDEKMTSIKLKECPKCKTPIRRNLRYGNMIKQALHDIENVKRQIMGDDARIKVLDQSIRQGIVKLSEASDSSSVPNNISCTISLLQTLHTFGHGSPHRPIHL